MATKELKILITASTAKLQSATSKAGRSIKKLGTTATRTGAKIGAVFAGLGRAIMTGPLAAFVSMAAVLGGVTKSLAAFAKQQAAVNRLGASIRKQGGDVRALRSEYEKTATSIQRLTGIGDESTLETMAQGLNLGVGTQDIEKMTVAAVGLSRVIKSDVNTAMMLLARGAKGQMQMFTRYGITLDQAKSKQEQFAEVMRISTDGFSLAEAELDDLTGKWDALKGAMGDTAEVAGGLIAEGTGLERWLVNIRHTLEDLQDAFAKDKSAPLWAKTLVDAFGKVKDAMLPSLKLFEKIRDAGAFWGAISAGATIEEAGAQAAKSARMEAKAKADKAKDRARVEKEAARIAELSNGKDVTVTEGAGKGGSGGTGGGTGGGSRYVSQTYDQRKDAEFIARARRKAKDHDVWKKIQQSNLDRYKALQEGLRHFIERAADMGDAKAKLRAAEKEAKRKEDQAKIRAFAFARREWARTEQNKKKVADVEQEPESNYEQASTGYTRGMSLGDLYGKRNRKTKFNRLSRRGLGDGLRTTSKRPVHEMGEGSVMGARAAARMAGLNKADDRFSEVLMDDASKQTRYMKRLVETNERIADNSEGVK